MSLLVLEASHVTRTLSRFAAGLVQFGLDGRCFWLLVSLRQYKISSLWKWIVVDKMARMISPWLLGLS